MALQLFKLALTGTTHTVPTATNYFKKTSAAFTVNTTTPHLVPKSLLITNSGAVLGAGALTLKTTNDGYYALVINGVMQQASAYSVTSTGVTLNVVTATANNYTIAASSVVTLAVTNFAPTTVVAG